MSAAQEDNPQRPGDFQLEFSPDAVSIMQAAQAKGIPDRIREMLPYAPWMHTALGLSSEVLSAMLPEGVQGPALATLLTPSVLTMQYMTAAEFRGIKPLSFMRAHMRQLSGYTEYLPRESYSDSRLEAVTADVANVLGKKQDRAQENGDMVPNGVRVLTPYNKAKLERVPIHKHVHLIKAQVPDEPANYVLVDHRMCAAFAKEEHPREWLQLRYFDPTVECYENQSHDMPVGNLHAWQEARDERITRRNRFIMSTVPDFVDRLRVRLRGEWRRRCRRRAVKAAARGDDDAEFWAPFEMIESLYEDSDSDDSDSDSDDDDDDDDEERYRVWESECIPREDEWLDFPDEFGDLATYNKLGMGCVAGGYVAVPIDNGSYYALYELMTQDRMTWFIEQNE